MKNIVTVLVSVLWLAGCASGLQQDPHAAHRAPAATAGAAPSSGAESMDPMMKSMHELHEKLSAAKTPEERAQLMQAHHQRMHADMRPDMMARHHEMMKGTMPSMGDCDAMKPPATR